MAVHHQYFVGEREDGLHERADRPLLVSGKDDGRETLPGRVVRTRPNSAHREPKVEILTDASRGELSGDIPKVR